MARHITPVILQMIARLSREGCTQSEIAAITRASQGAISKIRKQSRENVTPTKDLPDIVKYRQMLETGFCWEWSATTGSI